MREIPDEYKNLIDDSQYELNKKLYDACSKEAVDFAEVEKLLEMGADPLGATCGKDWYEHVYESLVYDASIDAFLMGNLLELTKLFLKYGMDISKPAIPYDDGDSINPLWSMSFGASEKMTQVLKLLLDNGLDADSVDEFCDHATLDIFFIDRLDPNDEEHNEFCVWTMKMIMLAASYDNVLEGADFLKKFICADKNDYDIKGFREYDNFKYVFNTDKDNIQIFEVTTNRLVWTVSVEFNLGFDF